VRKAFIFIFIYLTTTAQIYAERGPVIIQKEKITNVINCSSYFIDSTGTMSIADLIKLNSSKFKIPKRQALTTHISKSAVWVKFHAVNLSHEQAYLKIDNPTADSVQFFYYDPQKSSFVLVNYGYNISFENRTLMCPSIVFEIPFCGTNGADYYIRIVSRKRIYLPVFAGNIKPLSNLVFQDFILDALYFGLMFGMIIFNLFLAIFLKSRTYFIYVGFAITIGLFIFYWKGYSLYLSPPLKYFFSNYSNSLAATTIILSICFAIYFLKVEEYSKKLYYYCFFLIAINLPIFFFEFTGNKVLGVNIQMPAIQLTSLSLVIISAYIFYKGLKHARLHLLANGLYQISVSIFLISGYDFVPWPKYHSHILPIGHALEITILAFALVDRVHQLRKEKEKILKVSLEQEKNLYEELLNRENDLAASENELKIANHQLNTLNKDLIDKNGQLIDHQIQLFTSLEEARVLNNKLSLREEDLTSKEEELRQSLDELNLTYKQLKQSERMLTLAQKIGKTGSWKLNLKTGDLEFSEPLYDLFEIPYGAKLTTELMIKIIGEDVVKSTSLKITESVSTNKSFSVKYRLNLKNGNEKYVHSIGTPSVDENGDINEIFGYTQDITEIRKAEELLNKQTSELIESNKKAAEYKLMALRSVMNPHFLFNSLNSIQYFITKNDREQALTYLAMFAKLIRSILNSSIANYNSLLEEIEILRLYVNLESLRFMNKFKTEFEIDAALRNEEVLIPSLLLQPYIENAIIHGLFHKKGKEGILKITFRKMGKKVLCIVEDNGIGRANALEIKQGNNLHKSIGMLVTKERIDLINNDDQVSVVITDLFDIENQPSGTKVEVLVAYK
jgi:hypothetical protein